MSLTISTVAGLTAGSLATVAFVRYLYATFRGETRPNRATWWILTVVGCLLASSYYTLGARHAMWLVLSYALCPFITALVALKYGEGGWTTLDRWCVILAAVSAVVWWLSREPIVALLINLFIDFLGIVPTLRKSIDRPLSEDRTAWLINFLAAAVNVLAVEHWTPRLAIYPIYMVMINGLVIALLFRRRPKPRMV